ncbi:UbiA family prenyltransferase [Methylobacterium sp. A49B]|uniref:UbiA family prenyltransferase n=1 Tax=Methylobacterium mesophilicum SR1.6/6 TaxID=908290 RepID=A0A6B9FXA0_9HYPH|nr:UbiA family prenyltransferase [Methylobacterium mesophilicum]QGY05224.1 UbiA family prenyltransferase [Methylobacterium mesophilicum SR1.6/6]
MSLEQLTTAQARSDKTPLCVDLDGTLIHGDLLYEAVFAALKRSPGAAFELLGAMLQGRLAVKHVLARVAPFDPALLPYRTDLVEYLRQERAMGRPIHLVTASPRAWAEQVAAHIGIFDAVYGSESVNLKGAAKARFLAESHPDGYDYIGDAKADLHVWQGSRRVLRAGRGTRLQLADAKTSHRDFPTNVFPPFPLLRAMRPHQWLKNLLIFLPLCASHQIDNLGLVIDSAFAFIAFSLTASATYLFNDLLDIPSDRAHPRKRTRPFASGALSIPVGVAAGAILFGVALVIAAMTGVGFLAVLICYILLTVAYSVRLKLSMLIDVFTLATLYSARVVAGGAATGVPLSIWLLAFSMFLFLALAIVKRCAELVDRTKAVDERISGRGYFGGDLSVLQSLGSGSSFAAVLVLSLYAAQPEVTRLYANPALLWFIGPILLYWLSRMMLLAQRGHMHDDPIIFALRERKSQILILICVLVALAAVKLDMPMGLILPGK